jgi:polar amino acid transport system substrate-binding protein
MGARRHDRRHPLAGTALAASPTTWLAVLAGGLALAVAAGALAIPRLRDCQAADAQWDELRGRGALRAAIDPGWQPFSFFDETGWQGLDADLTREIARRLGWQVQPDPVGYDALYDALHLKRADAAVSAVVIDPSRLADTAYSIPYFDAGVRLVAGSQAGIRDIHDLSGRRVAVALGSDADRVARYWERRLPRLQRLALADDQAAFQALADGRADAALIDALAAARWADDSAHVMISVEPRLIAFAVRRDNTRLLEALDEAIAAAQADGTLDRLVDRWIRQHPRGG